MNRTCEREYYEVAYPDNSCKLMGEWDTLEEAVAKREEANKVAKDKGYPTVSYVILHTKYKAYYDGGNFVTSTTYCDVIDA